MSTPASEAWIAASSISAATPCSSSWPMEPQSEITVPSNPSLSRRSPLRSSLFPLIGLRSIALKAVMTIAGFAFNAIRKGFTYCSRNVRWDISTSLYSLPAFTAP